MQTEYSLFTRDVEDDGVLASVREPGIGFVPYSPLGRGFLSGRIRSVDDLAPDDRRRTSPRFQGENLARNLAVLDEVVALARDRGVTPSRLALAWSWPRATTSSRSPGTRRIADREENVAALGVTFTAADLANLDRLAPRGVASGDRYAAAGMQALNH